jgi:outer membrane protein
MDSLVSGLKFIKDYGKEWLFLYLWNWDAATMLYAEDKYDITKEVKSIEW